MFRIDWDLVLATIFVASVIISIFIALRNF